MKSAPLRCNVSELACTRVAIWYGCPERDGATVMIGLRAGGGRVRESGSGAHAKAEGESGYGAIYAVQSWALPVEDLLVLLCRRSVFYAKVLYLSLIPQ